MGDFVCLEDLGEVAGFNDVEYGHGLGGRDKKAGSSPAWKGSGFGMTYRCGGVGWVGRRG